MPRGNHKKIVYEVGPIEEVDTCALCKHESCQPREGVGAAAVFQSQLLAHDIVGLVCVCVCVQRE